MAPIGHTVTIEAATGTTVNVAFTLTLESSSSWEGISERCSGDETQDYFDSLISTWADSDHLTVRISQLESRILDARWGAGYHRDNHQRNSREPGAFQCGNPGTGDGDEPC